MTRDAAITDIWHDDLIGRKSDAELIEKFLTRRVSELRQRSKTACYTLNIDASWGQGKSFFLTRFESQLKANGYRVASINAWAEDYVDDPLVGVMAQILATFRIDKSPTTKKQLKTVAAATGKVVAVLGKHAAKAALTRVLPRWRRVRPDARQRSREGCVR